MTNNATWNINNFTAVPLDKTILDKVKSDDKSIFTIYLEDNEISESNHCGDMKEVSKEEYETFINSYPRPLEKDWYMDWYSWNDFTLGDHKWPDSVVAMCSDGSYDEPIIYKILENVN